MKEQVKSILLKYLELYPKEIERQSNFLDYLMRNKDNEIVNYKNYNGHITAGGFIYAKKEKKFLTVYHRHLNMFLSPGGHVEKSDVSPLEGAKREIKEETGLDNLEQLVTSKGELVPIDIDTHDVLFSSNFNIPEHYHFDFRYLFVVDEIRDVSISHQELKGYQWSDSIEPYNLETAPLIMNKINNVLNNL